MKKILLFVIPLLCFNKTFSQCPTPTPVIATPSVICAGASSSLNATSLGSSINWYTVPVGGVPTGSSASGADFGVSPAVTTTYYAEAFVVGTPSTQTFGFTGALQTYTVPAGITQVTLVVKGAQGQKGANTGASNPGSGGAAAGVLTVTPGQVLNIYVGGQSGYNGGGQYWGNPGLTCMGGGASDVRVGGITIADRVIVGGGGGGVSGETAWGNGGHGGGGIAVGANFRGGQGGAGYNNQPAGNGGTNGGTGVGPGAHNGAGGGGGMLSGGGGGTNNAYALAVAGTGSLGLGGAGNAPAGGCCQSYGCAGGGGGYYGGGGVSGGCCGGGGAGGGSSWTGTLANPSFTSGIQLLNGQVTVTWLTNACVNPIRPSVTVTVNPSPTITVNSGSICSGNSFTMVPSGANTYTFQGGNAVVSPTANTNYTVVGTGTNGCVSQTAATSSITVNASPLPTITVNSGSICSGNSFTMVPSGANTYTFQGGNAVVSPTANATYTVAGTNTAGCVSQSFATSSVTVAALPSLTVTGAGTICVGVQSATLTVSGANTYSWNTGSTSASIVVTPSATATYTANGTSSVTGCTGIITAVVTVDPCTGISNIGSEINGLFVYPNPSKGEFTISSDFDINLSIINNLGQVVKTLSLNKSNDYKVSINNLQSGVYFISGEKDGKSVKQKIIISK